MDVGKYKNGVKMLQIRVMTGKNGKNRSVLFLEACKVFACKTDKSNRILQVYNITHD